MAVVYEGGVALATDRSGSYGRTTKYKSVCRQYRVNENVVVAFSGDFADFQWLQNVIERTEADLRSYHKTSHLTAKGLHSYLSSMLYYRRSQMNPIWTTLIVAGECSGKEGILLFRLGMQPEPTYDNLVPFIGVIDQRGVAYESKAVATGMGQFILTEAMQTRARAQDFKLNREEALKMLRECIGIMVCRDCSASTEYDLTTVDSKGTELFKPERNVGNWDIAEYQCYY
jgi:20S proteasome subunit beta 7